jgi:hypothetical protein
MRDFMTAQGKRASKSRWTCAQVRTMAFETDADEK